MNIRRIILANVIVLFSALIIIELANNIIYKSKYIPLIRLQISNHQKNSFLNVIRSLPGYRKTVIYDFHKHRDRGKFYSHGNSDKRPIITVGCSYTSGVFLRKKETLAGQLRKITGRNVYNLGLPATGPQIVYEQLADPKLKESIPDAEYVIYIFLHNHILRQFMRIITPNLGDVSPTYYIDSEGNLKKRKYIFPKFVYSLFLYRNYLEYKLQKEEQNELESGLPLFMKTMEECVKAMKNNYSDSKFVLIEFPQAAICSPDYVEKSQELKDDEIKKLKDMGIIYINAEELVGHKFRDIEKYRIADRDHPNGKVWEEIAPALKKRLNL